MSAFALYACSGPTPHPAARGAPGAATGPDPAAAGEGPARAYSDPAARAAAAHAGSAAECELIAAVGASIGMPSIGCRRDPTPQRPAGTRVPSVAA